MAYKLLDDENNDVFRIVKLLRGLYDSILANLVKQNNLRKMEYKIVSTSKLGRFSTREEIESAETVSTEVAELVLAARECLLWLISDAQRYPQMERDSVGELRQLPLAANYHQTGSTDIRDKILVQDPIQMKGPYILDKVENPGNRVFKRRNIQGFGAPRIIDIHIAGDKIPNDRYYFIGSPCALFEELQRKGFSFEE